MILITLESLKPIIQNIFLFLILLEKIEEHGLIALGLRKQKLVLVVLVELYLVLI